MRSAKDFPLIRFICTDLFLKKAKQKNCRGKAIMQIATAAKASKELPLEGSCRRHSAKCPARKGGELPAEK